MHNVVKENFILAHISQVSVLAQSAESQAIEQRGRLLTSWWSEARERIEESGREIQSSRSQLQGPSSSNQALTPKRKSAVVPSLSHSLPKAPCCEALGRTSTYKQKCSTPGTQKIHVHLFLYFSPSVRVTRVLINPKCSLR